MRLAWATDIHLDFLADEQVRAFAGSLVADRPDAVILSGDLSHAEQLEHHLRLLAGGTSCPIYFVLGNHDYYGSSVAAVREAVAEICSRKPRLRWLPNRGVVELTATTAMIGCDGWADARLGDFGGTPVFLNDFIHIEELAATLDPAALHDRARLRSVDRTALHAALRARGDAEAALCEQLVREALARPARAAGGHARAALRRGVLARGGAEQRGLVAVLHVRGGRRGAAGAGAGPPGAADHGAVRAYPRGRRGADRGEPAGADRGGGVSPAAAAAGARGGVSGIRTLGGGL
jgi:3',5'-cyclic AMP phosphodiesterase CpdA